MCIFFPFALKAFWKFWMNNVYRLKAWTLHWMSFWGICWNDWCSCFYLEDTLPIFRLSWQSLLITTGLSRTNTAQSITVICVQWLSPKDYGSDIVGNHRHQFSIGLLLLPPKIFNCILFVSTDVYHFYRSYRLFCLNNLYASHHSLETTANCTWTLSKW